MPFQPHVRDELQRGVQGNSVAAHRNASAAPVVTTGSNQRWSDWERARFFQALERYPSGPWQDIANYIGSKTRRQVMCHAQKLRQKLARQQRREETLLALQPMRAEPTTATAPAPAPVPSMEQQVATTIEAELVMDGLPALDDEPMDESTLDRPMSPTMLALLSADSVDEFMAAWDHMFTDVPFPANEFEPLPANFLEPLE